MDSFQGCTSAMLFYNSFMRRPPRILAPLVLLLLCEAACYRIRHNSKDIEDPDIPPLSSGACDDVPVMAVQDLYVGPYELSPTRPDAGTVVAFEGRPTAMLMCTERGCEWECCDNACGYDPECACSLRADDYNRLCLASDGFACGGTDCSPWCRPFSTAPEYTYRFVGSIRYNGLLAYLDVAAYCRIETR